MKFQHILLCSLASIITLTGCDKEEHPIAELGTPMYHVQDDPSDPIQHLRYTLFESYRTYLITDPKTIDYQFNFERKNNLRITPPEQSTSMLEQGANMLEDVFLSHYPENFKEKNIPFSIILADSILFLGQEEKVPSYHSFASGRFLAMAGVRPEMKSYTEAQINEIRGDINSRYWVDYLGNHKGKFVVPESFSEVSAAFAGKSVEEISELGNVSGLSPEKIDYYTLGFTSYNPQTSFYDDKYEAWWIETPNSEADLRLWVSFLFKTPKAERTRIIDTYPLMKKKYEILKAAFRRCDGFDIELLP